MSIQEARRAAFEKWWNVHYGATESWIASSRTERGYSGPATQESWEAWNAALDSAAVELPNLKEFCGPDGFYMEYLEPESVLEAIEAAGIHVEMKS